MNKAQLLEAIAETSGQTKADVQKAIDSMIQTIATSLEADEDVALRRFGTYSWTSTAQSDGPSRDVSFHLSPHFVARCQPPEAQATQKAEATLEPEDTQETQTTQEPPAPQASPEPAPSPAESPEAGDPISELRALLAHGPSLWAMEKVTNFLWRVEAEGKEKELALSYAKEHFQQDVEWLPYADSRPEFHTLAPLPPPHYPKGELPKVAAGAIKRHQSILRAIALRDKINAMGMLSLSETLKKLPDQTQLAITNGKLHPKGWPSDLLDIVADDVQSLQECAKTAGLTKKGIFLVLLTNNNFEDWHTTLKEGCNNELNVRFGARVLMIDPETDRLMTFTTEGRYSAEFDRWWETVYAVNVYEPIQLLVDDELLLSDFDCEDPEPEDESDSQEPAPNDVAAQTLHEKLAETFPHHWSPDDVDEDKAPDDVKRLLEGLLDLFTHQERPIEDEHDEDDEW